MDRLPTVRTVALDDEGHIVEHVPCHKCGGELRGWSPQGLCPHCRWPIDVLTEDALTRATSDAPRCAGDLKLYESPDRCPRCGLPVAVSLSRVGACSATDGAQSLTHDVYCRKCGYNLRGLRREGLCPECATPVRLSLRKDLLCFAEPGYVAKLARGIRWIAHATAALVVCIAVSLGAALLVQQARNVQSGLLALVGMWLLVPGLALLGVNIVLLLIAVWLMTTAEPRVFGPRRRDTSRRLARVSLAIGLAGLALDKLLSEFSPPMRTLAALHIFAISSSMAGVIGIGSYMRYVRGMAERVPDRGLALRANGLAKSMTIAFGVLVLFYAGDTVICWSPVVIAPASPPGGVTPTTAPSMSMVAMSSQPLRFVRTCVTSVAGFAAFVYTIRTIALLRGLRKPLEQQAALAARHWDAAGGTGNIAL